MAPHKKMRPEYGGSILTASPKRSSFSLDHLPSRGTKVQATRNDIQLIFLVARDTGCHRAVGQEGIILG